MQNKITIIISLAVLLQISCSTMGDVAKVSIVVPILVGSEIVENKMEDYGYPDKRTREMAEYGVTGPQLENLKKANSAAKNMKEWESLK